MNAEREDLDLAAVLAEHQPNEAGRQAGNCCECNDGYDTPWPCLPRRIAAFALDLQGKVARVEAFVAKLRSDGYGACIYESAAEIGDIIADTLNDPTPTATCPKVTPFKSYTEPTCSRPEGHAGGCLFNSHDGRTPLEVMPGAKPKPDPYQRSADA